MQKARSSSKEKEMSESSRISFGEVSGFQYTEQNKTIVKKKLVFHATVLFILVVLAVIATLADTRISENLLTMKRTQRQLNGTNAKITKASQDKKGTYEILEVVFKSCITILSIGTVITLYYYYRAIFMLKVLRNFYPSTMSFLSATPLLYKFIIEVLICLLHVPPYTANENGVSPKLQIVVFLRIYLVGRFLRQKHELMNSQSTRFLASVTKTELSSMFLFKTFFMQYPFQMIFLGYTILLFIGGYGLWLVEEKYSYLDTLWMLVITMTTVGFGDLTPTTLVGRIAVGCASMIGIFLMALFISLVNEALMLKRREKRILAYVETQDNMRHRKTIALNAIGSWYRYYSYIKRYHKCKDLASEYLMPMNTGHWRMTTSALVFRFKAKILEQRMFKAINLWRNVKEDGDSQFFAQEFMVEDMKMLITDMGRKVDILMEKIPDEDGSASSKSKRSMKGSKISLSKSQREEKRNYCPQNEEKWNLNQPKDNTYFHKTQAENLIEFNRRRMFNGIGNILDNNREQIALQTLLSKKNEGNRHQLSEYHDEILVAFQLLQNQTNIMSHTLDDIYHKTKQDISDLQNIISSLLLCSDEHLYRQTESSEIIL